MSNQASFYINNSPPVDVDGNRGFDATASQLLELRLAQPVGVLTVEFRITKVSRYAWPLVFDETGEDSVLLGGGESNPGDSVHIGVGPAVDISSYVVRATAVTANATHIFERLIAVRKGGMRLTVPAETGQYSPRGWSDALNDITKAVADGGVITPLVSGSNVGAALSFPAGLRRIFSSDGSQEGGRWDVLTQTDIDAALAIQSISGTKLVNGSVGTNQLADGAVTTDKIGSGAVTLVQMASVATNTMLGRTAGGTGVVQALAVSTHQIPLRGSGAFALTTINNNQIVGRGDGGNLGPTAPHDFKFTMLGGGNPTLKPAPEFHGTGNIANGTNTNFDVNLASLAPGNGLYDFTVAVTAKGPGASEYYRAKAIISGQRISGTLTLDDQVDVPGGASSLTITLTATAGNLRINVANTTGVTVAVRVHAGWLFQDVM